MSAITCIENVKTFAKVRGIPLGQIEKEAGVSAGYLSRKRESGDIPLSVLMNIAQKLDVSVNDLLTEMTDADIFHHYVNTGCYNAIGIEKTEDGFCCYVTVGGHRYRTTPFKTMEEAGAYMSRCIGKRRKSK